MPPTATRLARALLREGFSLSYDGASYRVGVPSDPHAPPAEILLPPDLPLEDKAVRQLMALATARHPDGGGVCRVCATPDFHPGDGGIAIGSVVASEDVLIPQAVGTDINCGIRLHVSDLTVNRFLSGRAAFVDRLRGDYLLGTRDVAMTTATLRALFHAGIPGWVRGFRDAPHGRIARAELDQIEGETARVSDGGSLPGDAAWAPESLVTGDAVVRDEGMATIGRGNHFVEVQVVDEVVDRRRAWALGVRAGQMAFMIHSGSRAVGLHIGGRWQHRVREKWPAGVRYPETGIFPLSWASDPDLCRAYLTAERTASNYGFVNRMLLAELLRLRLREVFGPSVEAPLVADLSHNFTAFEAGRYVTRKGACPAHAEAPVIIPGSMGSPSYLAVGLGNERWLSSASHGAGRAERRGAMGRTVRDAAHARALGLDGVDCITLRDERRVEEAPSAYKPIQPVIDAQVAAGTIAVVARLRPLLTFKA